VVLVALLGVAGCTSEHNPGTAVSTRGSTHDAIGLFLIDFRRATQRSLYRSGGL